MSEAPQIDPPPGYGVVEVAPGRYEVRKTEEARLSKVIGWKVTTAEQNRLRPFVETFPQRSWSEAMRWLFSQQAVRDVMADRVLASSVKVDES